MLSSVLQTVLQAEIDPNVVRPGWIPLLVTVLLMLALLFLFFSMRKQIRRINVPGDGPDDAPEGTGNSPAPPETRD